MRLFGRNQPKKELPHVHSRESVRVLRAVGSPDFVNMCEGLERIAEIGRSLPPATHLDDLGAYEAWAPYTSIFQRTAFEGPYGDIVSTLARIESRVMFDD